MLGSESADIEQAKTRKIGILCDTGNELVIAYVGGYIQRDGDACLLVEPRVF